MADLQKDLRKIEKELTEIRKQANPTWRRTILMGILQGAGWLVGTALAALCIGWILSILGIIPGFEELEKKIETTLESRSRF